MWVILLVIMLTILLISFVSKVVSVKVLVYYMVKKEYILPTDQDLEECTKYVVKKMFKVG